VNDKPFTPDEIPKLLLNILNMRGDTIYITTLILGGKKMLQYGVMSDSMIKNYKNREDFVFLI
ncbi:MAG: hypothetical protein KDH96_08745, partial [Candidatus Riesia sp.]|nr:hypothetical protein [Candidatus Riesia sp.]